MLSDKRIDEIVKRMRREPGENSEMRFARAIEAACQPKPCVWTEGKKDEYPLAWSTECGYLLTREVDPTNAYVGFCSYCGGKLEVKRVSEIKSLRQRKEDILKTVREFLDQIRHIPIRPREKEFCTCSVVLNRAVNGENSWVCEWCGEEFVTAKSYRTQEEFYERRIREVLDAFRDLVGGDR